MDDWFEIEFSRREAETGVEGAEGEGSSEVQIVSFLMGGREFGVDIYQVQEIIRLGEITPIPEMPEFIEGVIDLRDEVIPVIDLRKRLRFKDVEKTPETNIIVAEVGGEIVGVIVDRVLEVLRLPVSSIEPPPPIIAGVGREYLRGVGRMDGRLLILLNMSRILTPEENRELREAKSEVV
ncbi:MAG: chemotaxis protein CheW [bacterium]